VAPAEHAALVNWMERIDKDVDAIKRNPHCYAAVAKSGHDIGFRYSGEPGVGHPCRQFADKGFVHGASIQTDAAKSWSPRWGVSAPYVRTNAFVARPDQTETRAFALAVINPD